MASPRSLWLALFSVASWLVLLPAGSLLGMAYGPASPGA